MSNDSNLLRVLRRTNPVPEPEALVDSAAAEELALKKPGSVVNWRVRGDEYLGDGYRIRLLEPRRWQITYRDAVLAYHHSLKTAFATVERHRRRAMRRNDLLRLAAVFVLVVLGSAAAFEFFEPRSLWGALALAGVFYVAVSTLIRFLAILSGDVNDPYQRAMPWERRRWWQRLLDR